MASESGCAALCLDFTKAALPVGGEKDSVEKLQCSMLSLLLVLNGNCCPCLTADRATFYSPKTQRQQPYFRKRMQDVVLKKNKQKNKTKQKQSCIIHFHNMYIYILDILLDVLSLEIFKVNMN